MSNEDTMTILVTGATGFLGEHLMGQLIHRESSLGRVIVIARPSSRVANLIASGAEVRFGDLSDLGSMKQAMQGADVLLNLTSLGFGHAPNIVRAAQEAQIQRAIFISTTAIFTHLPAHTKSIRLEAERLICESGLRYTILRPTMIYGTPRDRNIWRLIQFLRRSPVVPIMGTGEHLQQPVWVEDVAQATLGVIPVARTIGQAYNLAGEQPLSFVEMIDTVCQLLKRRVLKVHLPLTVMIWCARVLRQLPLGLRLTDEQIMRLNEDKAFSIEDAQRDFGYAPVSFETGVSHELTYLH